MQIENKLILLVGLPRSGKSTWCKTFKEENPNAVIVNIDSIRISLHGKRFEPLAEDFVWATAKVMVRALFMAGNSLLVLDATNTTKKSRSRWVNDDWETHYKIFDTPVHVCMMRAMRTGQKDLLIVITNMHDNYEPLTNEELTRNIKTEIKTEIKSVLWSEAKRISMKKFYSYHLPRQHLIYLIKKYKGNLNELCKNEDVPSREHLAKFVKTDKQLNTLWKSSKSQKTKKIQKE